MEKSRWVALVVQRFPPSTHAQCVLMLWSSMPDIFLLNLSCSQCHYRLRDIRGALLELWSMPLIFSVSKYFRRKYQPCPPFYPRPNIQDPFFQSVRYLIQALLRKYLQTTICCFRSPIPQKRGSQRKLLFWTQNLGHTSANCAISLVMGVKMSKK